MDEPDWVHRDSEVLVWQLPGEERELPEHVKKSKPVLHPAAGAAIIISALMTGTIFGTAMIRAINVPEEKQITASVSEPAVQETKKASVPLYIIQGGLFSTKAAAEKSAAEKKIPAAVVPMGSQFSVIYDAFSSRAEADESAKKIEASGLAAYVKQVDAEVAEKEEKALKEEKNSEKKLEQLISILSP